MIQQNSLGYSYVNVTDECRLVLSYPNPVSRGYEFDVTLKLIDTSNTANEVSASLKSFTIYDIIADVYRDCTLRPLSDESKFEDGSLTATCFLDPVLTPLNKIWLFYAEVQLQFGTDKPIVVQAKSKVLTFFKLAIIDFNVHGERCTSINDIVYRLGAEDNTIQFKVVIKDGTGKTVDFADRVILNVRCLNDRGNEVASIRSDTDTPVFEVISERTDQSIGNNGNGSKGYADVCVRFNDVPRDHQNKKFVIEVGSNDNRITRTSTPPILFKTYEEPRLCRTVTVLPKLVIKELTVRGKEVVPAEEIMYCKEGPRDENTIQFKVVIVDGAGNPVKLDYPVILKLRCRYDTGGDIANIRSDTDTPVFEVISERTDQSIGIQGYADVCVRFNDVSRNHQNKKFVIEVGSNDDRVTPTSTPPILVKSRESPPKFKKESEMGGPLHMLSRVASDSRYALKTITNKDVVEWMRKVITTLPSLERKRVYDDNMKQEIWLAADPNPAIQELLTSCPLSKSQRTHY